MYLFQSLFKLFYPDVCIACNTNLLHDEIILCSACRSELPETSFCNMSGNLVEETFKGRVPVIAGTSLLYYNKNKIVKSLIHKLKYKGRQDIGIFFGEWVSAQLLDTDRFSNIDAIIKVPLHPDKEKNRGYNQLTTFAKELSKKLSIPVYDNVLVKRTHSLSQTKKNKFHRFDNFSEKFYLADTTILRDKHILLVDDVLTTGATLEACSNELLKTPNIKISIATMTISV